jgi:hypothetical protein
MNSERRFGIVEYGKLLVTGAALSGVLLTSRARLGCERMNRSASIAWPRPIIICMRRWSITAGTARRRSTRARICARSGSAAIRVITAGGMKMSAGGIRIATGMRSMAIRTE